MTGNESRILLVGPDLDGPGLSALSGPGRRFERIGSPGQIEAVLQPEDVAVVVTQASGVDDPFVALATLVRGFPKAVHLAALVPGDVAALAAELRRDGAYDFVTLPLEAEALATALEKALVVGVLKNRLRRKKAGPRAGAAGGRVPEAPPPIPAARPAPPPAPLPVEPASPAQDPAVPVAAPGVSPSASPPSASAPPPPPGPVRDAGARAQPGPDAGDQGRRLAVLEAELRDLSDLARELEKERDDALRRQREARVGVEPLKVRIEELERELQVTRDRSQGSRQEQEAIAAERDSALARIAGLEAALAEGDTAVSRAVAETETALRRIEVLEAGLAEREPGGPDPVLEAERVRAARAEQERDQALARVVELAQAHQAQVAEVARLGAEASREADRRAGLEAEVVRLRDELERSVEVARSRVASELAAGEDSRSALEDLLARERQARERAESQLRDQDEARRARIETLLAEAMEARQGLVSLEAQLLAAAEKRSQLDAELAAATRKVREGEEAHQVAIGAVRGEADALRAELASAKAELERARAENRSLRSYEGLASGFRQKADEFEEQLAEAERKLTELVETADLLTGQRDQAQDQARRAEARLEEVLVRAEAAERERAEFEVRVEELEEQLRDARAKHLEAQLGLLQRDEAHREQVARLAEAGALVEEVQGRLEKALERLARAEERGRSLEEEVDQLLSAGRAEVQAAQDEEVARLRHRLQDLDGKLAAERVLRQQAETRAEEAETQHARAAAELTALDAQRERAALRAREAETALAAAQAGRQSDRVAMTGLVAFQEKLLDTLAAAVVMLDPQGRIAYSNHAAELLLGMDKGTLAGMSYRHVVGLRDLGAEIRRGLVGRPLAEGMARIETATRSLEVAFGSVRLEVGGVTRLVISLSPWVADPEAGQEPAPGGPEVPDPA